MQMSSIRYFSKQVSTIISCQTKPKKTKLVIHRTSSVDSKKLEPYMLCCGNGCVNCVLLEKVVDKVEAGKFLRK